MKIADIEELFRRLVDENYADSSLEGDARSLWRASFRGLEALSSDRERRTQGSFLLPHGTQTSPPATFGRRASLVVTLDRTGDRELALYAAPGKMTLVGPSGRLYVNVEPVEYSKRDPGSQRDVVFRCVVPGEAGNLLFLINDDLVSPAGSIPAEYLALADQSRGRVARGASSTTYNGSGAIKDSGIPATFEATDEGLYVEVLDSTGPGNQGRVLRIREHVWPGIEEPPESNVRPTIAVLDDAAVREDLFSAKLDDGGAFTTYTAELNDPALDAAPLLPAAPIVGDAFYFGASFPIASLVLRVDTAGTGDYAVAWEYWNGVAWVAPLGQVDGTLGLTAAGLRTVTFPEYASHVASVVDGVAAFWVRVRVSAVVALLTQPFASYAYPLTWQPLAPDAGGLEWAVRDWKDLGFVVAAARQIEIGREDDLFFHGDQRGQYRVQGESEEAFRARLSRRPDVVTPAALQRVVNRILAPLKLKGVVFDIGDEFKGFFYDVDAYDYYQPGDTYPLSPWKLLVSLNEYFGFFYVRLPWITTGDFGIFYDEGPLLYLPDLGLYLGPAYDEGFFDGSSYPGELIYRSLYEEIRRRKGGGIGFAFIPDEALNTP